jgi:hypothetical protein
VAVGELCCAATGIPDDPRVEVLYGDISDAESVRGAVRQCDALVHTTVATEGATATSSSRLYSVGQGTDDTTWLVNIKGLYNVSSSLMTCEPAQI